MKLEDKVLDVLRTNTEDKAGVTLASDLRKELHLDSFGTLMVINALEDAYGISVQEEDFAPLHTAGDVVGLLRAKYGCN